MPVFITFWRIKYFFNSYHVFWNRWHYTNNTITLFRLRKQQVSFIAQKVSVFHNNHAAAICRTATKDTHCIIWIAWEIYLERTYLSRYTYHMLNYFSVHTLIVISRVDVWYTVINRTQLTLHYNHSSRTGVVFVWNSWVQVSALPRVIRGLEL